MTYDVIIRNGLWFDGTGTVPQVRTLGIRGGIVAATCMIQTHASVPKGFSMMMRDRSTRPAAPT